MSSDAAPPVNIQTLVGAERLRRLERLRNGPGLLFLAGHFAVLGLSGVLVWASRDSLWLWPAMFVHGVVLVHLFGPQHEAAHMTAFKSRWLNTAVNWITGVLIFDQPTYFRLEHSAHHRFTQDVERDPERIPAADSVGGYFWYLTGLPYYWALATTLVRTARGRFIKSEEAFIPKSWRGRVARHSAIMLAIYGVAIIASVALMSDAILVYWALPLLLGQPVQRAIRKTEHGGCDKSPNFLRNTRTTLTNPVLRLLGWNMAYHAEHHAMTTVPFFRLGRAHDAVKDHLQFVARGYGAATADVLRRARGS
ncbi:MAG: fatty acid desaturase [Alphaproteobacteria bacterium]